MEENLILQLRNISKLNFQSKVNILKKSQAIPALTNLLQTTGQKKIEIASLIRSGMQEVNGSGDVFKEIVFLLSLFFVFNM